MDIDKYYITYTTTTDSTPVTTTVTKTHSGSYYDPNGTDLKNWMSDKSLKTLKVESTNTLLYAGGLFITIATLTSLDLSNFDTSRVENMEAMFYNCSSLTSLDLSNFDTSNVSDMSYMFYNCSSLTSLDLSNFDTSNVSGMNGMLAGCSSLTSLDLSNFDTSNVSDMNGMLAGCSSLTSLDLSNFDTSNVSDMSYMFYNCSSLTSLDLSNFDTSNVENMEAMFNECSALMTIYLGAFNVSNNLSDYYNIFEDTNDCHIYFTESEAVISTRKGYPWDVSTSRFVFDYDPGYDLKVRVGNSWVKKNYKIWDGNKWNEDLPLKIRHDDAWININ